MSAAQWAAMMRGDESYACATSFVRFEEAVREITGLPHVLPTHQGRAAERLLLGALVEPGDVVPGNGHFDTTRAQIEARGGTALDLPVAAAYAPSVAAPTKGDVDLDALARILAGSNHVPLVLMTITSNRAGGQPVSLDNLRAVAALCKSHDVPLFLDAARFAENAGLLRRRDPACAELTPREIALAIFDLADGCTMSAKKDGLVNIGGFVAVRSKALARRLEPTLIRDEGFPTYGGLAGRDLEALAVGLHEALDPTYLDDRLDAIAYLARRLEELGVPTVRPAGGHCVMVDAGAWLPQVQPLQYPGQALAVALYAEAGIRSCEIGSLMFGTGSDGVERPAGLELLRLAVPRRVYGREHLDYVASAFEWLRDRRERLRGFRVVGGPSTLRHFMADLAPV